MAQWASTRPDLFPPSLISKIEVLQDDVPVNYSMDIVERTLEKAFGADWKSKLSLDAQPLGSGSVAQVFKGVLKQSKEDLKVAIKMIHPHVEQLIHTDMELLNILASYVDKIPQLEMLSIADTCKEFAHAMHQQLDLRLEAKHLQTFNKKFSSETWAAFPKPIDGFVTKNVLVETLMQGTPIKQFMSLPDDINNYAVKLKMRLSDLGCRLVLKMVFFDNYIHGDLHPGNLMVEILPNGDPRLIVLDCGIVYSSPSEQEHKELADICLAFMQHDGYKAGRLMLDKAHRRALDIAHGTSDISKAQATAIPIATTAHDDKFTKQLAADEAFCQAIQQIVIDAESESYFEHMAEYLARICDLARQYQVRLDPGYFKIAMALKVAEGMSLAFDRNLDLITKCIPIVLKAQALRRLGLQKFPGPEDDTISETYSPPQSAKRN
jgi:aarF domain-containing kinase